MSPRRRVLVVNNNVAESELLTSHLADLTCEIKSCNSDADILDCVSLWQPNVVVLANPQHAASGLEICRQIKGNSATRKVLVLMIVHCATLSDVERAVDVGIDDFVTQPVDVPELANRVRNLQKTSGR